MRILEKRSLEEWTNSPTAEVIISLIQDLLDEAYQARCDCFIMNEPWQTQETRARLLGSEDSYQNILDILRMKPEALAFYFDDVDYQLLKTKEEVDTEDYGE